MKRGVRQDNGMAFGPRPRGRLGLLPPPLAGEGWGGGGTHAPGWAPPPYTSPAGGGGNAPTVRQQQSRHSDELDHGRLVRLRREADGGGAGGGERLRDLAGETKVHQRERALEHAGAGGTIEIGLRAAARKMQEPVEGTPRPRHPNVPRKALHLH